jgi:hypothetical protein
MQNRTSGHSFIKRQSNLIETHHDDDNNDNDHGAGDLFCVH